MLDHCRDVVEKAVVIGGVAELVEIEGDGNGDRVVDLVAGRGDALQSHD